MFHQNSKKKTSLIPGGSLTDRDGHPVDVHEGEVGRSDLHGNLDAMGPRTETVERTIEVIS